MNILKKGTFFIVYLIAVTLVEAQDVTLKLGNNDGTSKFTISNSSSTERVRITDDGKVGIGSIAYFEVTTGNVGIGTNTPTYWGDTRYHGLTIYDAPESTPFGTYILVEGRSPLIETKENKDNTYLHMAIYGSDRSYGDWDGQYRGWGILNTNSLQGLILGISKFSLASAPQIKFVTKSGIKMTINNSGDVGIGTETPQGKLDVNGTIYQRGTQIHADYVFEPNYRIESIKEHAEFMFKEKHLKAVPKAKKDEKGQDIVEYGSHMKGMLEELEKAHVYIAQQQKLIESLSERIKVLESKTNK